MGFPYNNIAGVTNYLWVEAKKESFANNDPVGTMTDWSGQGNTLTQGTGAAMPTFLTNEVNGLPAYSLDGGDYVAKTTASSISSSAFTIFSVLKRSGTGSRRTLLYVGQDVNAGRQILVDSSEAFRLTKSQIAEVAASSGTVSNSAYELWCVTYDGSTYTFYKNGVQDSTGSASQTFTDTTPTIYIGANSGLGELFLGKFALLLAYSALFTTAQRQEVENQVAEDYALFTAPLIRAPYLAPLSPDPALLRAPFVLATA